MWYHYFQKYMEVKTMKKIISISAVILITLLCLPLVLSYAQCGIGHVLGSNKEGEVINKICPVMEGGVDKDTPYKTEYNGKTIGFCCSGCVATFNANPEKYIEKLELDLE